VDVDQHDTGDVPRIAAMASFTSVAVPTSSTRDVNSASTPDRNRRWFVDEEDAPSPLQLQRHLGAFTPAST